MTKVEFVFSNDDAAKRFVKWLCNSGEQHYWEWMARAEIDEPGPITATNFDYWGGTNDGVEFGKHPIVATCGRLDEGEEQ